MKHHASRPLTTAIIEALTAAGLAAGDAEKPDGAGWQDTRGAGDFVPYVTVYPLGGMTDGPIDGPNEDAEVVYQLSAVGASRTQCEWAADRARTVLLETPLSIPGRVVTLVLADLVAGARRDDAIQPPVWYSPDRYQINTTPRRTP